MLDEFIENQKDEIVKEVCNLINIPSVSEETGNPDAPFGDSCVLGTLPKCIKVAVPKS